MKITIDFKLLFLLLFASWWMAIKTSIRWRQFTKWFSELIISFMRGGLINYMAIKRTWQVYIIMYVLCVLKHAAMYCIFCVPNFWFDYLVSNIIDVIRDKLEQSLRISFQCARENWRTIWNFCRSTVLKIYIYIFPETMT